MSLAGLLAAALAEPALARTAALAKNAAAADGLDLTGPAALRPFVVGAIASGDLGAGRPVLAVTATSREAEDLTEALRCLLPPDQVAFYPAWETLPHERLSPRSDTVGRRLAVLRRLAHPDPHDPLRGHVQVVVAPVRSVLQPQLKGLGDLVPVHLTVGSTHDLGDVTQALSDVAYARVDLVEKRGEFAVRGGILDVFPPTEEHPLRVEFWGDEVESIRYFSVADQRSLDKADVLWAPPCRELLLTPDVREKARELGRDYPGLAELTAKLAEGIPVEGMESLAPALLGPDRLELLTDCMPEGTVVVACDPERIRTRAHDLNATSEEFLAAGWAAAAAGAKTPIDLGAAAFRGISDVRDAASARGQAWWNLTPLVSDLSDIDTIVIGAQEAPKYHGDNAQLLIDLRAHLKAGRRVALVFPASGPAERAVELLRTAEFGAHLAASVDTLADLEPGTITVTTGSLGSGLVDEGAGLVVITGDDITGGRGTSTRDMRKMPSRRRGGVDPLELTAGDFVVHETHGVGQYVEMVRRTINDAEREYLVIEYAASKRGQPGDRLFVPTDQLDMLTRYVGGEQPTVHRLGGADWAKTKARARKAVKEIAAELIKLYAARQATEGYAYGEDTPWQRELEDAFPYHETPDQLAAIEEVKGDMRKLMPMDRLICGDVGYGKTEIAVRAAFKAVTEGKQVAVLVPTTLLAQQHFNTFTERMSQFPVTIKQLSRFQTPKEAEEVLTTMFSGEADIVIGTHRLIQPTSRFKDLGLVIVDEEQRFGVEHKEHLKQMRAAVDVLSMSATPIPRTLEMAITGIREMSTIATPPEERHPVLTSVGAYDERQITAAIRRELLRDGQVFFLHNRVESIEKAARRIRELVPEARVVTAHGKMGEDRLEKIMVGFWENEYDVLVATTIIESGIDIPNANTLIVERADLLGLSQLHQIRGRVGRGRERAYSYFLYPPDKPLTEQAHERLATIAQHTELGAGMYVAMKDLEIRGAGNLLGGEQSGHIAGVGFDLYVRMVGDAVASFKGDKREPLQEVKVDLPVDANIPYDYISVERLRLEMYRKLAEVRTEEHLAEVRAEMTDRYGEAPEPVDNLVEVARFRLLLRRYGLTDVALQGRHIRFSPMDLPDSRQMRLKRYYPDAVYKTTGDVVSLPRPTTGRMGGAPLSGLPLLKWAGELVTGVLDAPQPVS
ncbi:transcription-repair coupling factor [Phytomonospora endophytica]|uniref:Transcription-repair-coupling factor n=1 Tax=Phytomonospora endophytica TaxID=714109 RepID=A0A841FED5_9ACTN|nr:transcription-repair coupling factor [Phytomonospora endophytica]MBB6033373.1 transcription-repair coupling factor (superfamily II helicase) [Phytomonospora endophytica]GIG70856.1 transcription-repair-coupling factor [Phytomonospora endophytica]